MKCVEIEKNLDALMDGELKNSLQEETEVHLQNCRSCAAEFENLRSISQSLRRNRRVSAPARLDENVLRAFAEFHPEKKSKAVVSPPPKIGWFGIPRFAFAAAFVLFALTAFAAFQIGRISARTNEFSAKQTALPETASEIAETTQITRENEMTAEIQTIEIPVIREKIVKVPVVREKIVTRVVYVNAKDENDRQIQNDNQQTNDNPKNAAKESFTVKNRLRDNRYSTQINLEGFQVVSDLKPIIIKGENNEQ